MKAHELTAPSRSPRKRVGRGISSGSGKTAGRGTKGQNSRTGGGVRPGFEGGQNPLAKRLPKKRGFASLSRIKYQIINLDQLTKLAAGVYDISKFQAAGVVKHADQPVKLLGNGDVSKKLTLTVQQASRSAVDKVKAAGGTVELAPLPRRKG